MSKKVEYKCDVCSEIKPREDLKCIYYGWIKDPPKEGYLITEDLNGSDKHICKECIKMIKDYEWK